MQFLSPFRTALLAGVASLLFSLFVFPSISDAFRANPDPDRFGRVALNIAKGNGFVYEEGGSPVIERTPLYAFLIAGVFAVVGDYSLTGVQVFQAVVHALTSILVFVIVARTASRYAALIAQIIFAFHPILLWFTARIWVETTHSFFLVVVAYAMLLYFESPTLKWSIALGAAIGLSVLTKPILLLFPAVIAVLALRRFGRASYKSVMVVFVGVVIVVAPWTIRNYAVTGRIIPVNTSLGFNLIQGQVIGEEWPSGKGILEYWETAKARSDSILSPPGLTWESADGDLVLTRAFLESARNSPGTVLKRFTANFAAFWYLSESHAKSFSVGFLQLLLLIAVSFSLVVMPGNLRKALFPVLLLVMYYTFVHSTIVGWGRYSMPLIPLLLILAAPLAVRFEPASSL